MENQNMIKNNEGENEWIFPDLRVSVYKKIDAGELISEYADPTSIANAQETMFHQADSTESLKNYAKEQKEIEALKDEYFKKVEVLNNLILKLKNPISIVDEELIEIIEDIIRKIAKKIILKEIESEPGLINTIIDDLKKMIQAKNGMINVLVAKEDYSRLNQEQNELNVSVDVDEALEEGDIIIRSNFNEIRALLNERIDQLLRIQHD